MLRVGIALLVCLSLTAGELLVNTPVTAPIKHQPWWRLEEALYGYRPEFSAGIACFGPDNEPYLRFDDVLQTVDSEKHWVRLPFTGAIKQRFPSWDEKFMQGYFAEEHIVFDDAGDAYMLVNATRSSIGRLFLLHSTDRCRTWTAHAVGLGYGRLERRDGHTRLDRPPALLVHDSGMRGILQLVVPEKHADGSLDVSRSRVISEDSYLVANHSGGGNSVITVGDRIHVFFPGKTPIPKHERDGTPEYAVTYSLADKSLSVPIFLGYGGAGVPDAHNIPVVSTDSEGFLHVVLGAHHDSFKYTRSLKPNSILDGWTEPEVIGTPKRTPNEGSYTYVGLVCDNRDNLHVVGRWAGESYTFKLGYIRKPKGKPWEPNQNLVVPFKGNYHVWYHKFTIDRKDRLFLNYVCRASIKRADEVPSFGKKWPSADLTGRFLTQSHCLLMSDDNGDSWHLATSADLGAVPSTPTSNTTERQAPADIPELTSSPTGHLGGTFGELATWGKFLLAGVSGRVMVLDASAPNSMQPVGQTAPLGDQIVDIDARDGIVAVAAWRSGFHLFRLDDGGELSALGTWNKGEARRFEWIEDRIYLTAAKGGLRILDISDPKTVKEIGALRGREMYAVGIHGQIAYGVLGPHGVNVMDISDPTAPKEIRSLYAPTSSTDRKNSAYNVTARDGILYICPGPALSCLRVFDLANPLEPHETLDLEKPWGWGRPLATTENRIFIAGLKGLISLSSGSTPEQLASWGDGGTAGVTVNGSTAYASLGTQGLVALDISVPGMITEVGRYSQPRTPFALAAHASSLFVADWDVGIRVFSANAADQPVEGTLLTDYSHAFGLSATEHFLAVALGTDGAAVLRRSDHTELLRVTSEAGIRDIALLGQNLFLAEPGNGVRHVRFSADGKLAPVSVTQLPREALSLAVTNGLLFVGEMQHVNAGIRTFAIEGDQLREVSYVELDTDVWGLNVSEKQLFAALANGGTMVFDIGDTGHLRPAGTCPAGTDVIWDTCRIGERMYTATGKGGLRISRTQ